MLNWILTKLIAAYLYSTLVFLLLRLVSGLVRRKTEGYLQAANILLLMLLSVNLVNTIIWALRCQVCYGALFYWSLVNTFLLGFAFHLWILSRKLRTRVGYTVVTMILLFLYINPLSLEILIQGAFRDYQPSSWSVYYIPSENYLTACMGAIYFLLCWMWSGRRGGR